MGCYSAGQRVGKVLASGVQWRTVVLYIGVKWDTVDYSEVQWDSVGYSEGQ